MLLFFLLGLLSLVVAEGINCGGSALCPLATLENRANEGVMQGLRDALYVSTADPNTMYNNGDHVICISNSIAISIGIKGLITLGGDIPAGGVCVFPQNLKQPLSLASIRKLADALLKHSCTTCGYVPVHFVDQGSNDPSSGILKFDYVHDPVCVDNCLGTPVGAGTTNQVSTVQTTPLVTVQQSIVTVQQPATTVQTTPTVQTQVNSPTTTTTTAGHTATVTSVTPAAVTVVTGMALRHVYGMAAWISAIVQMSLYLGL